MLISVLQPSISQLIVSGLAACQVQVTKNIFMTFLDWKADSVPVQRYNHVDRAASIGEWRRRQGTGTGRSAHEVTLDPRMLQGQLKGAETASE